MRISRGFALLSLVGSSLGISHPGQQLPDPPSRAAAVIENNFIIEFGADTDYDATVKEIESQSGVKILKKLKSPVFSGVTIEAAQKDTSDFEKIPSVAQAWRSHRLRIVPPIESAELRSGGVASNYSVHEMTGVDQLHANGILGQGVKVAVVDSGIDYNHPALGGGFGPGFKVAGGYDFVGNGRWPEHPEVKNPDSDPMDQMGHGTHVAGIVAAKNDWFTGVAPEATLLAYKVFNQVDYTDEVTLIEAFLQAYEDGADIITASVVILDGWSNGAWATVSNRLVDEGIVVTIAAGNWGQDGPFRASSGSNAKNVLSIASVDPTTISANAIVVTLATDEGVEDRTIAYRPGYYSFAKTLQDVPVHPISLDPTVEDDACSSLPEDAPDLSGRIALVRVSTLCDQSTQVDNLLSLNPLGFLFYVNEEATFMIDPSTWQEVPAGMLTSEGGAAIVEKIAQGGNVTVDFTPEHLTSWPYSLGGAPSSFTAWGPTWELELKPDVAAPGASITSTYLTWEGSWTEMGGTSMATPYVAGIAALYIGKHGGRAVHGKGFAKMLHARIASSGASMQLENGDGQVLYASPTQIGTGLIDARKILNYNTQLSFERFELNDTHHFVPHHSVDITNNGDVEVVYTFHLQDAGTYDAFETDEDSELGSTTPVMNSLMWLRMYELAPRVTFPTGVFRVQPGQTRKAEFTFEMPELPAGHKGKDMPILSGKIIITGSNGEQLSVPYLGMVGDLRDSMRESKMFWTGIGSPVVYNGNEEEIWTHPYWNFDLTTRDWAELRVSFTYGVRELRWDIYEPNWTEDQWQYPPVIGENGFVGSVACWYTSLGNLFEPAIHDPDDAVPSPIYNLYRQWGFTFHWFGRLANGTQIAPGNYTMRVAALLPFGDRTASEDWDIAQFPEIMILPK